MSTETAKPDAANGWMLRVSTVLWLIWGLVHVLAGFTVISNDTSQAVAAVADAVDAETLEMDYPDAAGALVNQHGFNLLWIGAFTTIGSVFVWKRSKVAIFSLAVVAGLTDIGYFLFMDLGGFVNVVPGSVMTWICLSAVVLSFIACFRMKSSSDTIKE